jgi:hypothetical protein
MRKITTQWEEIPYSFAIPESLLRREQRPGDVSLGFLLWCSGLSLGACAPMTADIRNNEGTGHACVVWGTEARDGAKPCTKQDPPPPHSDPDTPL